MSFIIMIATSAGSESNIPTLERSETVAMEESTDTHYSRLISNALQGTGSRHISDPTKEGSFENPLISSFEFMTTTSSLQLPISKQKSSFGITPEPTSSILTSRKTIDRFGKNTSISVKGRHDPCVGIRAVPIGEAMMHCVLLDHYLMHNSQCNS